MFWRELLTPSSHWDPPIYTKEKKGPIFLSVTQLYGIFVQMCLDFF